MNKQKGEQYNLSLFKDNKHDHVAIICHDRPDPDAIASAMGIQEIVNNLGLKSAIYYGGEITHTQNRVMINVLNASMTKLDNEDENISKAIKDTIENSYIVVVDTSSFGIDNCSFIKNFINSDCIPDLIIDHHVFNAGISCEYIHKEYGSCSTIIFEMLEYYDIEISKNLSTALYLGITKDTDDLKSEGTTEEDILACDDLRPLIDLRAYLKIFNYKKPKALLGFRRKAYNAIFSDGNLITANVGVISSQQRALVAEICEELLTIEGIDTCVVLAIVDDRDSRAKYIEASLRTSALAMDANEFIQSIFGKKYSGGRKGAAASAIPLDKNICSVLDFFNTKEDKNGIDCFVDAIFETYQNKIRIYKEKM